MWIGKAEERVLDVFKCTLYVTIRRRRRAVPLLRGGGDEC